MKVKELQKLLKQKKIDYLLLINHEARWEPNFTYFTGIKKGFGSLLVSQKNATLLLPLIERNREFKTLIPKTKWMKKGLLNELKKLKNKKVAINEKTISVYLYKKLKKELNLRLVNFSKHLEELRETKTEQEIRLIKKSCSYADKIMNETVRFLSNLKTEKQTKEFIAKKIKQLNLEPSFEPIVSCHHPKELHRKTTNNKLKGFTVIDLGVRYQNYCSDITRTIYIGKPKKEEIEDYNKVLNLQLKLIKSKELSAIKLHNAAKRTLGKYFIHFLGHGIGIEIHELPGLSPKSKTKLKNNMVFTIEPGLYKKYGIRIEDDILIKNNKKIPLTKTRKDLIVIP